MVAKKGVQNQKQMQAVASPDMLDKSHFQRQLMGGTSYESNNVFKLINRTANNSTNHNKKDGGGNGTSMSPPLRPIAEEKQKIIIAASSTQSKFFINNSRNTNVATKARTSGLPQQENLKSYNITQEKFFPQSGKQTTQDMIQRMHQSFYNNSKQYQSNKECLMSMDFQDPRNIKKPMRVTAAANRQSQENMIKEHDEISEEDENEDTCNEDERRRSPQQRSNKKPQMPYQGEEYPMAGAGGERPTNRLGCSRAFHQMNTTKDNWQTSNTREQEGQYSCKATSSCSSTSLNLVNKTSIGIAQSAGGNNQSSVSPKPFQKQTWGNNAQKIQEMQKEVNLMYLGGIAANQKKKAGAGIKLNPINASTNNSYIL